MTDPLVQTDPAGNVTLVWRKRTANKRFDLWGRRFSGGSWGPAALLESRDTNSVFFPALAVGANGTAVATWYYGTSSTSGRTFTAEGRRSTQRSSRRPWLVPESGAGGGDV